MARVTVEDCIQVVNNRYELVLLAAQRARNIAAGAEITVPRDNDKNPVVALREIADQTINLDELRRHIAKGVNRQHDLNVEDDILLALTEQGPQVDDTQSGESDFQISEIGFEDEEANEAAEAEAGAHEADHVDHSEDSDEPVVMDDLPSAEEIEAELAAEDNAPEIDLEDNTRAG